MIGGEANDWPDTEDCLDPVIQRFSAPATVSSSRCENTSSALRKRGVQNPRRVVRRNASAGKRQNRGFGVVRDGRVYRARRSMACARLRSRCIDRRQSCVRHSMPDNRCPSSPVVAEAAGVYLPSRSMSSTRRRVFSTSISSTGLSARPFSSAA